ncbi:hypothetical protein PAXRUDRAFT_80484, partial [Paxillus rubicundulus Ve08.2h10]
SQNIYHLFIIGGTSLYQEALKPSHCAMMQANCFLLACLHAPEFKCDMFFPDVLGGAAWRRVSYKGHSAWGGFEVPERIQQEGGIDFEYQMWAR